MLLSSKIEKNSIEVFSLYMENQIIVIQGNIGVGKTTLV
jgi:putative ribosome biogenesis GTPase RsgA